SPNRADGVMICFSDIRERKRKKPAGAGTRTY
ncbi:MAG: hypothetical protein ACD_6C00242G0001, partial [uncultured bacterium]